MNRGSGRSDASTGGEDFGPFLTAVIAVCLFLFGFPAWLPGFLASWCNAPSNGSCP